MSIADMRRCWSREMPTGSNRAALLLSLVSSDVTIKRRRRRALRVIVELIPGVKVNAAFATVTEKKAYALAASCLPNGRKYCVPLIGAETFRSNSCKSWLRSTKSISEVFTISKSDDV